MREGEREKVCKAFNSIEKRLSKETIESWKAQLPDFWDQLDGLREFLEVKKMICPENDFTQIARKNK